jgi:hypothetical protein
MPELPKREESLGVQLQVRRRQPDVTPLARGVQAQAEAAVQFGSTLRQVGENLERRNERMAREKQLNKANNIYNSSYGDATQAFIDEIHNDGKNNIDPERPDENPLDRFNRISEEILEARLEGLDEQTSQLVRTRFGERKNYWDERLAIKQVKDIQKNRVSNLDQAMDNYSKSVFADPGSLENVLDGVDVDIAASGLTGEDAQNARIEARDRLAKEALLGIAQKQPKTAEKLLESGAYDNLLKDPDSKRDLQKRIKTQAGLLKGRRDEAINQTREKWRNEALDKMSTGELREAQIMASPLEAKEKQQWISKVSQQAKDFNAFLTSDDIIKADVTERVYTEPDTITTQEIFNLMGKGLSTADATTLGNKLREIQGKKGDPLKNSEISQAITQIELMRKSNFFDVSIRPSKKPTIENNIEAGRQKVALEQWSRENPDKSPLDYIDALTKTEGGGFNNWITSFFTTSDQSALEGLLPVTLLSEDVIEELTPAELRGRLEAETEQGRRARESVEQLRALSSRAVQMLRQAGQPVTRANVEEVTKRLLRQERGER